MIVLMPSIQAYGSYSNYLESIRSTWNGIKYYSRKLQVNYFLVTVHIMKYGIGEQNK